jgi:hypothetical protein
MRAIDQDDMDQMLSRTVDASNPPNFPAGNPSVGHFANQCMVINKQSRLGFLMQASWINVV